MYIQTQDGKAIMPCKAIGNNYDEGKGVHIITVFYPENRQSYKVAHYRNEKQFKSVFRELQENLVNGERKIYYMPQDAGCI
ncbi:hypothetical protein Ami103574_00105 [Aminipila butyrica]|uniref:Uncharacterized protein n=1 Tax=Aminipila butyrica TaxID=433296 RepID=A0A858BUR6_9FIRM|nr:hypothetical protein [Aminipila butyrica]QIB67816.1 hypothetical protein Ami103574_00105 [Aminipila butyrica]